MIEIMKNPWLSSLIVLITQILFVYCRTLNVIYTSDRKLIPTIITGNIIGICWLVTMSMGVSAMLNLQWQPILAHLLGGTAGVVLGFKTDKKLTQLDERN